ncbi:helix-turn-helix domain-containing protein [Actinophytocola sp.]|uniref:helix-turn-helix domain-containing protein n=1 Tax=Actinophytocola sp. TaxID=1872138 RepID=UPI003899D599
MTTASADVAALLAQVVQLLTTIPPATVPAPRPASSPDRVLLTVEEAADRLRVGRTTAWGLVRNGQLRSVQIGRLRRVPLSAVDTYAARLAAAWQNTSDDEER